MKWEGTQEENKTKQMPLGLLDIQAVICLPILAAQYHSDDLHSQKTICGGQHSLLHTLLLSSE